VLPFADILREASVREVLNEHGVRYRDRCSVRSPPFGAFWDRVLSEDHSCRDAMSRIIAHRAANGNTVCSPNTASYCNARSRLVTSVLSTLAMRTAQELQLSAVDEWKWSGRSVFVVDGSTVSMPDTDENQAVYPQPSNQKPELGFPLARLRYKKRNPVLQETGFRDSKIRKRINAAELPRDKSTPTPQGPAARSCSVREPGCRSRRYCYPGK